MDDPTAPGAPTPPPPVPFVVGAGRSGNTLLRLILDAHRDLAIPPETDFLVEVAKRCRGAPDPRQEFLQIVLSHWRWADCHLDPDEFQEAVDALRPFDLSEGVRCFYRLYAARFGKTRWGDKTPFYLGHMVLIQDLVPEARFVHIIRDGRDAALSIKDLWFGPSSLPEAALWWTKAIERARAQTDRLSHYIEIRYEDLVRDMESTVRRVCQFLDLPWDSSMLSFHLRSAERVSEVVTDRRKPDGTLIATAAQRHAVHRLTLNPPDSTRLERWRVEMSGAENKRFYRIAGKLLAELGYAKE